MITTSGDMRNMHVDNCAVTYEEHTDVQGRPSNYPMTFNLKELDVKTVELRSQGADNLDSGKFPDYAVLVAVRGARPKLFFKGPSFAGAGNVVAALKAAIVTCSTPRSDWWWLTNW